MAFDYESLIQRFFLDLSSFSPLAHKPRLQKQNLLEIMNHAKKNLQKIISKLQGGSDRSFITSITKGIGLNI